MRCQCGAVVLPGVLMFFLFFCQGVPLQCNEQYTESCDFHLINSSLQVMTGFGRTGELFAFQHFDGAFGTKVVVPLPAFGLCLLMVWDYDVTFFIVGSGGYVSLHSHHFTSMILNVWVWSQSSSNPFIYRRKCICIPHILTKEGTLSEKRQKTSRYLKPQKNTNQHCANTSKVAEW